MQIYKRNINQTSDCFGLFTAILVCEKMIIVLFQKSCQCIYILFLWRHIYPVQTRTSAQTRESYVIRQMSFKSSRKWFSWMMFCSYCGSYLYFDRSKCVCWNVIHMGGNGNKRQFDHGDIHLLVMSFTCVSHGHSLP